jgi:hypothetical protein
MDIKESDLLILSMVRQEVFCLGVPYRQKVDSIIWKHTVEELNFTSDRSYAWYKKWKNFVKRVGKKAVLRGLLEFMPMIKFYNEFYYDIDVPLAMKSSRQILRNEWLGVDISCVIDHLDRWSVDGNEDSKKYLKSINILHSTHDYTLLISYINNLVGLVVGPKKFTYYYFWASRYAAGMFNGLSSVEHCIKYRIAKDIIDKYD